MIAGIDVHDGELAGYRVDHKLELGLTRADAVERRPIVQCHLRSTDRHRLTGDALLGVRRLERLQALRHDLFAHPDDRDPLGPLQRIG